MNYASLVPSRRISSIPQAASIYINQLVYQLKRQGVDIVALSLGEAFFNLPELDWRGIDIESGYHYGDSQGLPLLREKISRYYHQRYGSPVTSENVLISCGSKPLIYMCMLCVTDPGDQVLVHEPSWLSYVEQAKLADLSTKYIPYDTPIDNFNYYFGERTRLLIINNPNNPAGRLYTREDLKLLYSQCLEHGIFLLVDEAYSDFVEEDFPTLWGVSENRSGMLVVNSLSKNLGMSGWRIGYVIAEEPIVRALLKANQHLITCAPTLLAQYVAYHFETLVDATASQVADIVKKRKRIKGIIEGLHLSAMPGDSTFYFFVNVESYPYSTLELTLDLLLNHNIAVVPGSAYGSSTENYIRISIGTEDEKRIHDALFVIKSKLQPDCPRPEIDARLKLFGLPSWQN